MVRRKACPKRAIEDTLPTHEDDSPVIPEEGLSPLEGNLTSLPSEEDLSPPPAKRPCPDPDPDPDQDTLLSMADPDTLRSMAISELEYLSKSHKVTAHRNHLRTPSPLCQGMLPHVSVRLSTNRIPTRNKKKLKMGISRRVMLEQALKHLDGDEVVIEHEMDNVEEIDEYPSDIFTEHDV